MVRKCGKSCKETKFNYNVEHFIDSGYSLVLRLWTFFPQVGSVITEDCFSVCIKIYVGPGLLVQEHCLCARNWYLRTVEQTLR